jgi:hypothetical protein
MKGATQNQVDVREFLGSVNFDVDEVVFVLIYLFIYLFCYCGLILDV